MDPHPPQSNPNDTPAPNRHAPQAPTPQPSPYPRPPRFFLRFAMLCLQPESWAHAGRYPLRFTLAPLILALILAAAIAGFGAGFRFDSGLKDFADQYAAAGVAPLYLNSTGILSAGPDWKQPLRTPFGNGTLIIDPAANAPPDDDDSNQTILITDHEVIQKMFGTELSRNAIKDWPYSMLVPASGQITIDADAIRSFAQNRAAPIIAFIACFTGIFHALSDLIWILIAIFMLYPLPMIAAATGQRRFLIPRRAAIRMVAGLITPLIILGGLLEALGCPLSAVVGQWSTPLWLLATGILAFYTGLTARRLFAPIPQSKIKK